MILSLVSTRLIFRQLGAETLGIISFAVTLTFLFVAIADMGISMVVTREVAAHRETNPGYVVRLTESVSVIGWGAFLITSAIMIVVAPVLSEYWLQIETTHRESVSLALQVIGVSLLLAIPRGFYGAVISGYERMDLWNVANVLMIGIQQLGMIVIVASGGGLLRVAVWYAVSATIGLLPFLFLVAKMVGVKALLPIYHHDVLRQNTRFGMQLLATAGVGYVVTQVDRWVIGRFLPVSFLGYYGFAQGLVSRGGIVPGVIANAAFPALAATVGKNKKAEWITQYAKLDNLCRYVYAPVSAAIALLGIPVTALVFNKEVAEQLWFPLLALVVAQYMVGTLSVPTWLAVALKRPDLLLRANLAALPLVVPATVGLTYWLGITGAALGALVYAVWQYVYFVPHFCRDCLGESPAPWFRRTVLFLSLMVVAYGLPWLVAAVSGQGLTLIGLLCVYGVGTVIFTVAGWRIVGNELRGELRHQIRQLTRVFSKKEMYPGV